MAIEADTSASPMTGSGYGSSVSGPATPYQRFAARLRGREPLIGYWIALDSPASTERLGRLGFDYVAFDAQHGLIGYDGLLRGLLAVDAGHRAVGVVRVGANDQYLIGRALDAGAVAVIVSLIDNAEQAAVAVSYTRYAPTGVRSYGPMRSALRIGPDPAEAHDQVAVLAMIETADGLANVEKICAVTGLAAVYIGLASPSSRSPRTSPTSNWRLEHTWPRLADIRTDEGGQRCPPDRQRLSFASDPLRCKLTRAGSKGPPGEVQARRSLWCSW